MSFVPFKTEVEDIKKSPPSTELTKENNPIFLIPGIVGRAQEMTELATSLNTINHGKRPLYIHHDPRLTGDFDPEENIHKSFTLARHAKMIAKEMLNKRQRNGMPFLIVGYSYGCILAVEIARYLRTKGLDACVYLIDGPSADCSSRYLNSNSAYAVSDLIRILNYTANIAELSGINKDNGQLINELTSKPFADKFENIIQLILDNNNTVTNSETDPKEIFKELANIVKTSLENIMTIQPPAKQSLTQLNAIFTENTAKKYNSETGGWDKYAKQLKLEQTGELRDKDHTELLNVSNAKQLANTINRAFKNEITEERLQKNDKRYKKYKDLKSKLEEMIQSDEDSSLSDEDTNYQNSPVLRSRVPYVSQVTHHQKSGFTKLFGGISNFFKQPNTNKADQLQSTTPSLKAVKRG